MDNFFVKNKLAANIFIFLDFHSYTVIHAKTCFKTLLQISEIAKRFFLLPIFSRNSGTIEMVQQSISYACTDEKITTSCVRCYFFPIFLSQFRNCSKICNEIETQQMQMCSRPKTSFHLVFPLLRNVDDGNFKMETQTKQAVGAILNYSVSELFSVSDSYEHVFLLSRTFALDMNLNRKKNLQKFIENAAKLCHISYSRVALLL